MGHMNNRNRWRWNVAVALLALLMIAFIPLPRERGVRACAQWIADARRRYPGW